MSTRDVTIAHLRTLTEPGAAIEFMHQAISLLRKEYDADYEWSRKLRDVAIDQVKAMRAKGFTETDAVIWVIDAISERFERMNPDASRTIIEGMHR
jgi:hypothetical protein